MSHVTASLGEPPTIVDTLIVLYHSFSHNYALSSSRCKGCFGRSTTSHAIVLSIDLEVEDCPDYDVGGSGAYFESFRSMRFSEMCFQDINTMSILLAHANPEDMFFHRNDVRNGVKRLVAFVNDNGGFTVGGWHRRGTLQDADNGDEYVSTETPGHITLLAPTDPKIVLSDEFKRKQISSTPTSTYSV